MERSIVGFHRDAASDWVADLACGHGRHVRHTPPWQDRPWVEDAAAREARVGTPLDCARCDRRELPEGSQELRRTAPFDADSMPAGLRRRHATKAGVWARICVTSGALRCVFHAPLDETQLIEPGLACLVPPEVEHDVTPEGDVTFFLAFLTRRDD
jgi:tellurite resistance-related uncharacterized protein